MSLMFAKSAAAAGLGVLAEMNLAPALFANKEGLFALTPLTLIGLGFFSLSHGLQVGKARADAMELAKKDGEKDVEERYNLPNLYAQGTSKHARAFNCIQRSHQHIFETYTAASIMGCTAALSFPLAAAVSTAIYTLGRIKLTQGYYDCAAKHGGDASQRYNGSKLSVLMWYGFLGNLFLGTASCIKILLTVQLA